MLCSNCGKNAAQFYYKKIEGKELRLALCSDCYKKLYPEEEENFFRSLLGNVSMHKKACPACGTTIDDFRNTSLLGCAYCYTAFREELTPTVRYVQGRIRHEGKAPGTATEEKYDMVRELVSLREELRAQIAQAEEAGEYLFAETLREKLAEITRKLRGEDSE